MNLIALLIVVPLISALILLLAGTSKTYSPLLKLCAMITAGVSLYFTAAFFPQLLSSGTGLQIHSGVMTYSIAAIEAAMALYIIGCGIKAKKYPVAVMAFLQAVIILVFEFTAGHKVVKVSTFYIDKLSLVMILIIGVIGSLICIFAGKYMADYHHHHPEVKDRRKLFYAAFFVFLSAMFGLVTANELTLMLFFWEITSLCSFILIGYSQTEEAKNNAFLALTINVFGGLLFTIGIVILGLKYNTGDFITLYTKAKSGNLLYTAVFLIAVAGLTKSAQMPFSKWLLGAMVAPTPVSAMLHSSTMVKAGVYLIIRLAPMLGHNATGVSVTTVGAVTFFTAAAMAVSQSDGKKILAYSTISNLGLIVACAGINTTASLWAAVMLIIFHAIAKSLLFLTVGATEHQTGSRNVENMDGLYNLSPRLAVLLSIGIVGMFVAPFGMLISKWAAIKAFLVNNNAIILLMIAFGSTITFFFWTKWLGKIITNTRNIQNNDYKMGADEKISLYTLGVMVIAICAVYPLVSKYFVMPFIYSFKALSINSLLTIIPEATYGDIINITNTSIVLSMMFIIFVLAIILIPIYKMSKLAPSTVYMAGENTGDNITYHGSMGQTVKVELKNWYMENIFGENLWFNKTQILTSVALLLGLVFTIGGFAL